MKTCLAALLLLIGLVTIGVLLFIYDSFRFIPYILWVGGSLSALGLLRLVGIHPNRQLLPPPPTRQWTGGLPHDPMVRGAAGQTPPAVDQQDRLPIR